MFIVFRARWIFGGGLTTGEVPSDEDDEEEEELEGGSVLLAKADELMVAVLGDGDEEQ